MYKLLKKFNKCNSMPETQKYIIKKYNLDEWFFGYITKQCIELELICGISISVSMSNRHITTYAKNIYITYQGFEFLKNYHSTIYKLLRDLFLIVLTATITVLIDNKLSNSNQNINTTDNVTSDSSVCSAVCNNSN